MPDLRHISAQVEMESRKRKRENVMKLVQSMIIGGIDLSPEEMVDAAFSMDERIDKKLYGKE